LIRSGVSLLPDMKFGWRPKEVTIGAPIPLYYDYEPFEVPINPNNGKKYDPHYIGPRPKHSIEVHRLFANKKIRNDE
jgi:hypothetical protein